jgi:hypothetical protein
MDAPDLDPSTDPAWIALLARQEQENKKYGEQDTQIKAAKDAKQAAALEAEEARWHAQEETFIHEARRVVIVRAVMIAKMAASVAAAAASRAYTVSTPLPRRRKVTTGDKQAFAELKCGCRGKQHPKGPARCPLHFRIERADPNITKAITRDALLQTPTMQPGQSRQPINRIGRFKSNEDAVQVHMHQKLHTLRTIRTKAAGACWSIQSYFGIRARIFPPPPDSYGKVAPLGEDSLAINAALDWAKWRTKHDILDMLEKTTVGDPDEEKVLKDMPCRVLV